MSAPSHSASASASTSSIPFVAARATENTIFLLGCKKCGTATVGRCPRCQQTAYCSPRCFIDDVHAHLVTCPATGQSSQNTQVPLSASSPLTDYESQNPVGWCKVRDLISSKDVRLASHFLVVYSNSSDVDFMSWKEWSERFLPEQDRSKCHAVMVSLVNNPDKKINCIVMNEKGSFYHARFKAFLEDA